MTATKSKWIAKVELLLKKAERTNFPEEAKALNEKAAEIMATYAIDEMMLNFDPDHPEQVEVVPVTIPAPYAKDRIIIAHQVAVAMGCDFYYIPVARSGYKTLVNDRNHDLQGRLVGYTGDIEKVTFMLKSLFKQEASERKAAVSNAIASGSLGQKKIFSGSFIRSYAYEVARRIREVYGDVERQQVESTALAIRDKKKAVADKMGSLHLRHKRSSANNSLLGNAMGKQAAQRATFASGSIAGGQQ